LPDASKNYNLIYPLYTLNETDQAFQLIYEDKLALLVNVDVNKGFKTKCWLVNDQMKSNKKKVENTVTNCDSFRNISNPLNQYLFVYN